MLSDGSVCFQGWLTDMGIKYYESKLNLQWKPILKNILADPVGFVEQGGWDFLDMEVGFSLVDEVCFAP